MDSYSQRFDSTTGRDSKPQKKKGFSNYSNSCYDEGDRKPKFLDRFASIRIPGSKKERPPLTQSKHNSNDWSTSSSSTSHHFEELSSKITSEKEILALFEKMMEDMNLNEDKKTPLRDKDLNTKREMVIQYMFTASKTGSLRSSHQISPQEFLGELKSGVMDERLFACLDSLRVSLTSNPVRHFLAEQRDFEVIWNFLQLWSITSRCSPLTPLYLIHLSCAGSLSLPVKRGHSTSPQEQQGYKM